jgi:predicted amidohydrolase YtcJ
VVVQNPLRGIHAALNRRPWAEGLLDHRQSLADTLASYTRDAAYAEFQEDRKGRLRTGMLADMVLLSGDIEKTPVEEIEVTLTMCGGRMMR